MAEEEDDDLYDEEFDFVDEDDEEEGDAPAEDSEMAEEPAEERARDDRDDVDAEPQDARADLPEDEYGRTEPAPNYVVHVYEHQKFKRTIDRPFTPEDAEAFATEFNRTSKNYGRMAVTGKNDAKPKKALD